MKSWQKRYRTVNINHNATIMNNNVKVYTAVIDGVDEKSLEAAMDKLPEWRKRHVEKKTLSDKINGAFAYLILKYASEREFGAFDSSPFTYASGGKPYFSSSDLFFSISHCKTAVGAAVSKSEIGFDLMDNRTINERITRIICTEGELRQFEAADDKQEFLRRLWCKKESAVKKTGIGFTAGFKTVNTDKSDFKLKITSVYTASVCGGGEAEFKEIHWSELIK